MIMEGTKIKVSVTCLLPDQENGRNSPESYFTAFLTVLGETNAEMI